jgi:hypothetical protein
MTPPPNDATVAEQWAWYEYKLGLRARESQRTLRNLRMTFFGVYMLALDSLSDVSHKKTEDEAVEWLEARRQECLTELTPRGPHRTN